MSSLIQELQRKILDPTIPTAELLRSALIVASKLNITEFELWINSELNGYKDIENLPSYRQVNGQVIAHNLYEMVPVKFAIPETEKILSKRNLFNPIAELEDMAENRADIPTIEFIFPAGTLKGLSLDSEFVVLSINKTVLKGIVDIIKNTVLSWSLQLERDGIVGDEISFSEQEKNTAKSIVYNIKNFTGVFGDVSADSVGIGQNFELLSNIKDLGLPDTEVSEIEKIMQELPNADSNQKASLTKKGFAWLSRNYGKLGSLAIKITEDLTKGA